MDIDRGPPYIQPTCYPAVSGGESVTRLSLGKLLVNLVQVVKRTDTPLKSFTLKHLPSAGAGTGSDPNDRIIGIALFCRCCAMAYFVAVFPYHDHTHANLKPFLIDCCATTAVLLFVVRVENAGMGIAAELSSKLSLIPSTLENRYGRQFR